MTRTATLRKALLEFAVIVLGVLVALGVDQWNGSRQDRARETDYLGRLAADLRLDTAALNMERDNFRLLAKEAALKELLEVDLPSLSGLAAGQAVAELIAVASAGGWGFLPTASATFDDLQSTGALSLISDPDLRFAIANYYRTYEWSSELTNARRSGFPDFAYEIVPRPVGDDFTAASISMDQLERLRIALASPEFPRLATAEINRIHYMLTEFALLRTQAIQLLSRVELQADS